MPLNVFYTMVQKSQKWPKTQIKGGYSHFRLVRTRLTRNFGLHARKPLVQNQIALTHILYGFG